MQSNYAHFSTVACDIFSIIPHSVRVEDDFSLGRHVLGWRQPKTSGDTLCKKVIIRPFAWANNGPLAGDDPALYMTNTETTWK